MTGLYHLEIPKTAGGIGHLEFSSGIAFEVCLTLCGTVYFGDSAADDMSLFKVNNIHYPPPQQIEGFSRSHTCLLSSYLSKRKRSLEEVG